MFRRASAWILAATLLGLAVVPALLAQALHSSPRELLNVARPLTTTEITSVLNASRKALTAKTFRLSSVPGQVQEVLMGPGGRPKMTRSTYGAVSGVVGGIPGGATFRTEMREDFINIVDYTDRPARRCDGSVEQGEMVIGYQHLSSTNTWTATAFRRDARDAGGPGSAPEFEMLRGVGPVTCGERRQIGDRWARAFVSPWTVPDPRYEPLLITGDPIPNVGRPATNDPMQLLWIDAESLLLLRWEVFRLGMRTNVLDFTYESIDLRPPRGIEAPQCIR